MDVKMRLALFNANGISGKADIIARKMQEYTIDIVNVVETHERAERALMHPKLMVCREMTQERAIGGRRANGGISIVAPDMGKEEFQTHVLDPEGNFIIYVIEDTVIAVGYFPPAEWASDKLFSFLNQAEEYAGERPLIIMGDFNARMGEYTGDHAVTPGRGERMREWIEGSTLQLERPETGKYTCFGGATSLGRGIPDLVLSRDCPVHGLTVLEDETWGGSDHRPLIFEIPGEAERAAREFQRWNIRRFGEDIVRTQYRECLEASEERVSEKLDNATSPDEAWQCVREWIEEGARNSCGVFQYKRTAGLHRDFLTPELEERLKSVQEQEAVIGAERREILTGEDIDPEMREAFTRHRRSLKTSHDALKAELESRRRALFHQSVDKLGEPQVAAAFMRMVKNTRARKTKGACQLDPAKLEEHASHFRNTFGGELPHIEENLDGTPDFVQGPPLRVNRWRLAGMLTNFALGKAGGTDGLTGELLTYGGPAMVRVLATLFQKIAGWPHIPDDWKTALIVPIWKQKGDPKLMSNYRPIALTCVTRRLYEKIILEDLEAASQRLSDFQGGFRSSRSTLDQVYTLNETMESNEGLHAVFLDLRAAYDLVDRRILWRKLREQFGVHDSIIYRLSALFDFNNSVVIVGNKRAQPLGNKRGLLQGSSASPILFNFYINDLVHQLQGEARVHTSGVNMNCLLFADDTVVFAKTLIALRRLLTVVETWAGANHMRFAPEKCVYVGPAQDHNLTMYGQQLVRKESAKYLGIYFRESGIDWHQTGIERTNKARGIAAMLNSLGMNATGWAPESSVRVYKTFIRPVMEYGIALYPVCKQVHEPAQKVQDLALRLLFSAPKSTSREAMAALCDLEPMELRQQTLQVKFVKRLYNSLDKSRPAVTLTRNKAQTVVRRQRRADKEGAFSTLGECILRNPLWRDASKVNHLVTPLQQPRVEGKWGVKRAREDDDEEEEDQRNPPPPPNQTPSEETERHRWMVRKRALLDQRRSKVAKAIGPPRNKGGKHFLMKNACPREERMTLKKWRLGECCNHQVCAHCEDQELSRKHGVECSEASVLLRRECPQLLGRMAVLPPEENELDLVLNEAERVGSRSMLNAAIKAIELILRRCRKLERHENGFWRPNEPEEGHAARWTARQIVQPRENRAPQVQRVQARRPGRPAGRARRPGPYERQ